MKTTPLRSLVKRITPGWALDRYRARRDRVLLDRFREHLEGFEERVVSHVYSGVPLEVWITDYVAEGWYDRDWPTANEIEFLGRGKLRPGARVFDVGAHQCVVAMLLAEAIRPGGKVIAVEAHPHNAAVGRRNVERNGVSDVEVIHAAAGRRAGSIVLQETDLNSKVEKVGEVGRVEVEAVSIDDLTAAHGLPDVVTVDVEGFECEVLRGATATLAGRPDLLIEAHVGCGLEEFGESVESLLALVPTDGYDLFLAPGVRDDAAEFPGDFVPFRPDHPILKARFFLAALASPAGAPPP